jgi:hypothetical protein
MKIKSESLFFSFLFVSLLFGRCQQIDYEKIILGEINLETNEVIKFNDNLLAKSGPEDETILMSKLHPDHSKWYIKQLVIKTDKDTVTWFYPLSTDERGMLHFDLSFRFPEIPQQAFFFLQSCTDGPVITRRECNEEWSCSDGSGMGCDLKNGNCMCITGGACMPSDMDVPVTDVLDEDGSDDFTN